MAATDPRWSLGWIRAWADLLDSRFRVPGTNIRFGLDPLLSLVPGIGELASPAFAVALIVQAVRLRVPKVIVVRMMLNALLDSVIGAVPLAGTVGDIFWRANNRNFRLLEKYAIPGQTPTRGDYLFVGAILGVFVIAVALIVAFAVWLLMLLLTTVGAGVV